MAAVNIGKKFYYDYFKDLTINLVESKVVASFDGDDIHARKAAVTREIEFSTYQNVIKNCLEPLGNIAPFTLLTTYPGLLLGSGYHHEVGVKEELILGFFFDHSTGLPLIPGSSIKGVLRSAFAAPVYILSKLRQAFEKNGEQDLPTQLSEEENGEQDLSTQLFEYVKVLELEIFGPEHGQVAERKLAAQDVFYDAVPVDSATGYLLAEDNITPHINRKNTKLNPFTEPIPLTFLKVLPGVAYRFDFALFNSRHIPQLSPKIKQDFFKGILLDLGVGAKTNVGYGHFTDQTIAEFRKQYGNQSPFSTPS